MSSNADATCLSEQGISAISDFRVTRFFDTGTTGAASLIDLEVARGAYAPSPGQEGLLFTTGVAAGGIGRLDMDGNFVNWLVEPGSVYFPSTAYLEYAYEDLLYACDTVSSNDIWRIYPDGQVEKVADYPNCEGIIFGDISDGVPALYVSSWTGGKVTRVNREGTLKDIAFNFPEWVTDLAIPATGSSFALGLYAVQQSAPGVYRIAPSGSVILPYPYDSEFTGGEEGSFAPPDSPFGDALYHPSGNRVLRLFPDGRVEAVVWGMPINVRLHTVGGVFSNDGRSYYFTNEESIIWRLQPCSGNARPIAVCEDVVLEVDDSCSACGSIDAGSFDPDGDEIVVSEDPGCSYGLGDHGVTLTVTDESGASATCSAGLTVIDATAPTAVVSEMILMSYPRDYKMYEYQLSDCAAIESDNCDRKLEINRFGQIVSISSDEPDIYGIDDPDGDIEIVDSSRFRIRNQRDPYGNGRVYRVDFTVSDQSGNTSEVYTCKIGVRVFIDDHGCHDTPIDDGTVEHIVYPKYRDPTGHLLAGSGS
ncbi:MAG: hypothetical protein MJE77_33845 [Proteobacteria bacterium]|nr:hypothetical protein [Pseudomonadota bacterium]